MKKSILFTILMLLIFEILNGQNFNLIKELVSQSDLVFEGEIISKESNWSPDRTFIYTENLVQVNKLFKGQLSDSLVLVITKGGKVGEEMQIHTYCANLPSNQTGVFYVSDETDLQIKNNLFRLYTRKRLFSKN